MFLIEITSYTQRFLNGKSSHRPGKQPVRLHLLR